MDPFSWKGIPKEQEEEREEATGSRSSRQTNNINNPPSHHTTQRHGGATTGSTRSPPSDAAITNSIKTGNSGGNTTTPMEHEAETNSRHEYQHYPYQQETHPHHHHQQHRDDIWTTNEMSQLLMPSPSAPTSAAAVPGLSSNTQGHSNHPSSNISDPSLSSGAAQENSRSTNPNNHHYIHPPPPALPQGPRGGGDRNAEHYTHHQEQASDSPFGAATSITENMHSQQAHQQWYSQQQKQHSLPSSYYYNDNSRPQQEPNSNVVKHQRAPPPDLAPPAGPATTQDFYEQQDPQYRGGNNYNVNVTPVASSIFDNKNSASAINNSVPSAGQQASSNPWYSWPQHQRNNLHTGEHGANQHQKHQHAPNNMYPPFSGTPSNFQDQAQHQHFYNHPYANAWGFRNDQQQMYQNNFMPPQQMIHPSSSTPGFHERGNFLNQQSGMGPLLLSPYGVGNSGESDDEKQKKKKRKFAKVADNEPRRPLSAYNFFFSEEKEIVIALLPDIGKNTGTAATTSAASIELSTSSETKEDDGDAKKDPGTSVKDMTVEEIQDFLVESKEKLSPDSLATIRQKIEDKTESTLQAHLEGDKEKKSHKKSHGKISFQKLASIIGKRWRSLSDTGRKRYYDLAKQDQERFKAQERQLEKEEGRPSKRN